MTRREAYAQARILKKMGAEVAIVELDMDYDVTLISGLDGYLNDGWHLVEKF